MQFRLELNIPPFKRTIGLKDPIMLIGSCFTDHISKRLAMHKFRVLENPHGILFNPKSIENALAAYVNDKRYVHADLFHFNDLWTSWEHHGQFSHPDAAVALQMMNEAVAEAHAFLQQAAHVIITLGSSWVYELKDDSLGGIKGQVAANCHKVPQLHFDHRLMTGEEVHASLRSIVMSIRSINPDAQVIFTVSPVRHHREGLIENNRSKALLITGVHQMTMDFDHVQYFPSYELIIDDLRDHRFYAEDLVHPNYQATRYVWDKFVGACMDKETRLIMDEVIKIVHAKEHRTLHPYTEQHRRFLSSMLEKTRQLQHRIPYIDLSEELIYFATTVG